MKARKISYLSPDCDQFFLRLDVSLCESGFTSDANEDVNEEEFEWYPNN